jgi:hypothetical protein
MNTNTILGKPDTVWKSPYTAQGDCHIKKCGSFGLFENEHIEIPKDAVVKDGNLALKGQTNSHAFYGGKFQLFEKDGITFLRVDEATVLDHVKDHTYGQAHAEHHGQWIPPGEYFIDHILEYDHIREESRQIID